MTDLEHLTELPSDFDGRVRLFPLPDLVVFPNAMQPLHIFEPRYCEMLSEAMAGDRLIAMATLAPDWFQASSEAPRVEPQVCICRVMSHAATEDDRHNILVVGVRRGRILAEEANNRPFRTARVEVLEDVYPAAAAKAREALKGRLLDAFRHLIPDVAEVQKNLHELMATQMQLGPVTDIIGFTMQFDEQRKLQLLGQPDVDARALALIEILETRRYEQHESDFPSLPRRQSFPPPFSVN